MLENTSVKVLNLSGVLGSSAFVRYSEEQIRLIGEAKLVDLTGLEAAREFAKIAGQQIQFFEALADVLQQKRIQYLYLNGNKFFDIAILCLARALRFSKLKILEMDRCDFPNIASLTQMLQGLSGSRTLKSLSLMASISDVQCHGAIGPFLELYQKHSARLMIDEVIRLHFLKLIANLQSVSSPKVSAVHSPVGSGKKPSPLSLADVPENGLLPADDRFKLSPQRSRVSLDGRSVEAKRGEVKFPPAVRRGRGSLEADGKAHEEVRFPTLKRWRAIPSPTDAALKIDGVRFPIVGKRSSSTEEVSPVSDSDGNSPAAARCRVFSFDQEGDKRPRHRRQEQLLSVDWAAAQPPRLSLNGKFSPPREQNEDMLVGLGTLTLRPAFSPLSSIAFGSPISRRFGLEVDPLSPGLGLSPEARRTLKA